MSYDSKSGMKTQMFGSLLIGFGVGMVLLGPLRSDRHLPIQEPATNMFTASPNQVGSLLGRSHPGAVLGRASPYNLRSLYGTASRAAATAKVGRAARLGHLARAVLAVRATSEDVRSRLESALKVAEECVGECAVEWDDVEELSASVADTSAPAAAGKVTKEDLEILKATQEAMAQVRTSETVDLKKVEELAALAAKTKETVRKYSADKVAKIDEALAAALEAAKSCTDDCAVAWETVEELSEAKANEKA